VLYPGAGMAKNSSFLENSKRLLEDLSDPLGGLILRRNNFSVFAESGDVEVLSLLSKVPAQVGDPADSPSGDTFVKASGSGFSKEAAVAPALAELIERRAAYSIDQRRVFWASARELGRYALDLASLPACSKTELENPRCAVVTPSKDIPIRWMEGTSLNTGEQRAIPYSLVTLSHASLRPQERLQVPISTGLAAHTSMVEAVEAGLLELIERDALSIMWLQQLPGGSLPGWPSEESAMKNEAAPETGVQWFFVDIRTDLDVPTLLCLRVASREVFGHTLIACSAGFDMDLLIRKTVRDACAATIRFRTPPTIPDGIEDFTEIHHGMTYMAHRDRSHAFSFLLESKQNLFDSPKTDSFRDNDPVKRVTYLVERLDQFGLEAFAVPLTSLEAHSVGLQVVRMVAPGLQPLAHRYDTRYLAHPRLYDAPRRMGFQVRPESEVNHWPLPFV
jgi:ribosomal protein S12 methylthiotransferase accessory factor